MLTLFALFISGFAIFYLYLVLRHREKAKLLNFASYVGLGIAFFLVIHLTVLMVYPTKIQEVELPLTILNENKEVRRGEFLKLQIHIKKYIDNPSVVSPTILCENGYYYVYPNVTSNMPMGEQIFIVSNIYQIPIDAPIGVCVVRATDSFKLNIFRENTTVQESEQFKVVE